VGLLDNAEDNHLIVFNVVKDTNIVHPQPILRLFQAAHSLDATFALGRRRMLKMVVNRVAHFGPVIGTITRLTIAKNRSTVSPPLINIIPKLEKMNKIPALIFIFLDVKRKCFVFG
jgi:hypothetical protein